MTHHHYTNLPGGIALSIKHNVIECLPYTQVRDEHKIPRYIDAAKLDPIIKKKKIIFSK